MARPGWHRVSERRRGARFVSWLSGISLMLGYLWALWNDDKTWHDQLSGTTVVRAGE